MRILQIGLSHNPGGVESFVMNYYRELVKYGVQFDFISMYDSLAYEDEIKSLGGTVFYISNVKRHSDSFSKRTFKDIERGEICCNSCEYAVCCKHCTTGNWEKSRGAKSDRTFPQFFYTRVAEKYTAPFEQAADFTLCH